MPDRSHANNPARRASSPTATTPVCAIHDTIAQQIQGLGDRQLELLKFTAEQTAINQTVDHSLKQLYTAVFTGDGEPALVVQLTRVMDSVEATRAAVADLTESVSRTAVRIESHENRIHDRLATIDREGSYAFQRLSREQQDERKTTIDRKLAVVLAILSGFLGIAGTLAAAYADGLFH